MTRFGKPFEHYIQEITCAAAKNAEEKYSVLFQNEFPYMYKGESKASSDCYFRIGNVLIAVEAKAKSPHSDTLTGVSREAIDTEVNELMVNPVIQVLTRLNEINSDDNNIPEETLKFFFGVEQTIILSVSMEKVQPMKVQNVTTRVVDKYIQTLQKTPAVNTRTHHAKTEFVTNATIEKIIKLLRCAFKQAVRWELVAKNPFDNVVLPKVEYKKRDIWTADMIRTALDQCTDSKLYVAMNLAFACSLRMGEILGLTWSNVHISDEDIADDNAYVYIDKELARASKRAIEMLGQKDIYHVE